MNEATRKSYHHTRVMWDGGVISDAATFCHEFGENPDVEELKRYNIEAQARECDHSKLEYIDTGERTFWTCGGCDLSDPKWMDKFEPCPMWHSEWDREKCKRCGDLRLIRKVAVL